MNSISIYKGKPTVYLDHNILDCFTKYGLGQLGQTLIDEYQVVYSDETLKEIRRSKGFENNFLSILKELNAYHLTLIVEQPNFTMTDNAKIAERDPFVIFNEYCKSSDDGIDLSYSIQQFGLKFSGGRKGDSFHDIHNEQISAFSQLLDSITDNSSVLPVEIQSQLDSNFKDLKTLYKETLNKTESMLLKNIEDDKNWNGIKDFRAETGIEPVHLNNIEPPNVLVKIWGEFKELPFYSESNMDIDDFFNLKVNPLNPDQEYFNYQKVTGIYNLLNTFGYHPDTKLHKEGRYIAATSDNNHASLASFCDLLLSNDERFIKKTAAAYEYLGIPTIVKHVVFKYEPQK
jgi:hypothetical protein